MDWRILVFYPEPEARDKIYPIKKTLVTISIITRFHSKPIRDLCYRMLPNKLWFSWQCIYLRIDMQLLSGNPIDFFIYLLITKISIKLYVKIWSG
jgi:hypothetical protein